MASKAYEDKHRNDPPVTVTHRKNGCELDGKRGTHQHSQADWREHIDNVGKQMERDGWGRKGGR